MTRQEIISKQVELPTGDKVTLGDVLTYYNISTVSPFFKDIENSISINGKQSSRAIYNLIVTKRDVNLYANLGMKPHRFWKISDVKNYFGIKGNKQAVKDKIELMCELFAPRKEEKTNA